MPNIRGKGLQYRQNAGARTGRAYSTKIEGLERRLCLSATFAIPVYGGNLSSANGIATADLNGDGSQDLIVIGQDLVNQISNVEVSLGTQSGFGTPTSHGLPGTSAGVATGDFLGNGKQDVVIVDSSSNQLQFMEGDGTGNLTYRSNTPIGGTRGDTKVVAFDFNGDKKDDIAVVDPVDQSVNVYFSQGTGAFGSEQSISVPSPIGVVVGDFNGDGIADLAALSSNGSVYIALNNGSGGFPVATPYNTGIKTPTSIAPAGLVSIAAPGAQNATLEVSSRDLVVAGTNGSAGVVTPLISHSDGTFTVGTQVSLSIHPSAIATGLFETNVNDDVAVLSADGSLQVLSCPGDGTLGGAQTIFSSSLGANVNDAVSANFANGAGIAFVTSAHSFGVTIANTQFVPAQNIATKLAGTLPASVIGGVKFAGNEKLVITARNSAVNGTASAKVFLSPDASPADSIATLASTNIKLGLKAGKSKTVSLKFPNSIPASAASGQYHLILQVTDTTGITTTIDSGRTINVVAPVVDLAGSFVKVPVSVKAGKKFSVTFQVTNLSSANVAATGPLPIQFAASTDGELDDTAVPLLSQTRRIDIKPGKSVRFTLQTSLSSPAYLFSNLDPGNAVFPDDADPSNNIFRTSSLIETT